MASASAIPVRKGQRAASKTKEAVTMEQTDQIETQSVSSQSSTLNQLSRRFGVSAESISRLITDGKVFSVPELKESYSEIEAEEIYCTVIDEVAPEALRI